MTTTLVSGQLSLRGHQLDLDSPRVMGVINLTPDSFYGDSRHQDPGAAREAAVTMVAAGADLLDLGAVSSRPGSESIDVEEESARLLPALAAVRDAVDVPVSVDTYRPLVAARAIDAGADLLNDITGLGESDELARLAARHGLGLVIMHMRGTPRTMQADTHYQDLVGEVRETLAHAADRARAAGLPEAQIVIDPGIGFGKSVAGNVEILRHLDVFTALGYPVLIGASRKSFIGALTGAAVDDRLPGSLAAASAAVLGGAHIIRAHDVAATVQAVKLAAHLRASALQPKCS